MNDCSHNMDVAIDTPLFFGSLVILRDLSHGRTIVLTVGLLYTQKKRLWLLTSDDILLF